MPAINKAIGSRIVYNQTELRYVLQQLHRHRRDSWKIMQNADKAKADRKRKGINSRRSDVSNIVSYKIYRIAVMLIKFYFIILFKKKERRKRGIEHMFNTNSAILARYRPISLPEQDYKMDIENAINSAYHSDEASETDEEKVQEEISQNIRPKNKPDTDMHVLRVYDKPWRSRRVS